MRYVVALLVATCVGLGVAAVRRRSLTEVIGRYLEPPEDDPGSRPGVRRGAVGGRALAMATGAMVGLLLAQGDLFLAEGGRSPVALGAVGAAAGLVLHSMRATSLRERMIRRVRYELPIVADAMALQIVSGESIGSGLRAVARSANGTLASRVRDVVLAADDLGLEEALDGAAREAVHPDERRLYEVLGHAHTSGGRTGEGLVALAVDFRASLERDITRQGGRKAVTAYGPVLVLMVPTALAFLLYPTLVGLRTLAGSP